MTLNIRAGPPLEIGELAIGRRRITPTPGGALEGPRLGGEVLVGRRLEVDPSRWGMHTDLSCWLATRAALCHHSPS